MVGAVVLVLVLVLLAPALLDGGAGSSDNGEFQPSADSGKRTEVIILNAPVNAQPAPSNSVSNSARRSASEGPAVTDSVNKSQRRPPAKPRVAARVPEVVQSQQGFAVQLGSFSEQANAGRYAARLEADGYAAFVQRGSAASGAVYRVYSGPAASREAASELAARLKSAGHSVMVVELGRGSGG